MGRPATELSGRQFGLLRVVRRVANAKCGKAVWECECECGKHTSVRSAHLTTGSSSSCGCTKGQASVWITANGVTQRAANWARQLGCTQSVICNRMASGWSQERAVTTPVKQQAKSPTRKVSEEKWI